MYAHVSEAPRRRWRHCRRPPMSPTGAAKSMQHQHTRLECSSACTCIITCMCVCVLRGAFGSCPEALLLSAAVVGSRVSKCFGFEDFNWVFDWKFVRAFALFCLWENRWWTWSAVPMPIDCALDLSCPMQLYYFFNDSGIGSLNLNPEHDSFTNVATHKSWYMNRSCVDMEKNTRGCSAIV